VLGKSHPTWNNLFAATKHRHIDQVETMIKSELAKHLVDELHLHFVKRYHLNHFSDYICYLANLLHGSSELSEKAMMDLKQAYKQLSCHELTLLTWE